MRAVTTAVSKGGGCQPRRRILVAWWLAAAGTCLATGLPAGASSLTVQGSTTHTGEWAARIDLSSSCPADDRTLANGTDYGGTTTEDACVSLSANDVDVLAGADVTFRAGERIVLGPGFSVASGASFTAVADPQVAGAAFVESGHPGSETEYWARFYVFPDALDMKGESFLHFSGHDPTGGLELAVGLKQNMGLGENRVFVQAVGDGGGVETTEGSNELVVPDGWHFIEVRWRASSGSDDGLAEVCVDDSPGGGTNCAEISGLDNDTGRIDSVRWGVLALPQGSFGTLYLDDFRARELGPVGGCETEQTCP